MQSGMAPETERAYLEEMVAIFDAALPARPTGWLGPGLTETFETPRLLRQLGFEYLLDWVCDDQPFSLTIPGMISVPYSADVNDLALEFGGTRLGAEYETIVMDHFEGLLEASATTGMVMALPIHPFIVGQPGRLKFLRRILRAICSTEGVWVCTSDDIARHYLTSGLSTPTLA
jgi:hypothetical protein